MPNRLKDISVVEMSLVDNPAEPNARVALFKRDDSDDDGKAEDGPLKSFLKTLGVIAKDDEAVEQMEDDLQKEADDLASDDGDDSNDEGRDDSSTEESMDLDKSTLDPEVVEAIDKAEEEKAEALAKAEALQVQVDELTKAAEDAKSEDDPEDLLKSADPAIRELVQKAQDEAEEATAIAKAEREKRLDREFFEKADSLPNIEGETSELADLLKSVAGVVDADTFAKLEEILRAADSQLATAELFKSVGVEGEAEGDDAYGKLVKIAKRYQEADESMTYEAAFDQAVEKNPDLYDEYAREV